MNDIFIHNEHTFSIEDRAKLDTGEFWFTIRVNKEIARFIRMQEPQCWYEHKNMIHSSVFDVSEHTLTLISLQWPRTARC